MSIRKADIATNSIFETNEGDLKYFRSYQRYDIR
jgi:hypothetical protein